MRASRRVVATMLAVLSLAASACTSPAPPESPGPSDPTPSAPAAPSAPRGPSRITDVNCDGVVDLVMGSVTGTGDDGSPWRAGSVTVRYGGSDRLQVIDQVALGDKAGRAAGASVVTGDLNSDGCSDVVVGDAEADDGASSPVWALWGSREGVSADRSTVLISGESGLGRQLAFVPLPSPVLVVSSGEGPRLYPISADGTLGPYRLLDVRTPSRRDAFSSSLSGAVLSASGDLLAVGAPEYSDEGRDYPGAVWVVRLLPALRYQATRIAQDSADVPGSAVPNDEFAASISLFHGYLAIGVPGSVLPGAAGTGKIQVFRIPEGTGAPRVSYLTTIDGRRGGVPGTQPSHFFGRGVEVYRPCDGVYGALVLTVYPDDDTGSATSVPFAPSGACPTSLLADSVTGRTEIGVSRSSQDGSAADTALVVSPRQELLTITAGTINRIHLDDAPSTVLAPPAA